MLLRKPLLFLAALSVAADPGHAGIDPRLADAEIRALLSDQVDAGNRGDIDRFVAGYADDALFVTSAGTTKGRSEVAARYKRNYSGAKAMGRLTLEIEELRLSDGAEVTGARVLAKWKLEFEGAAPRTGPTLLVLERRDGRFQITEDASMELEPPR